MQKKIDLAGPARAHLAVSRGWFRTGPIKGTAQKAGRNDPCPCGSGKKYKQCCRKT